ncbi:MAG: hypothetical protein VW547_05525 [Alphaproteobacteria bacterium]
MTRPILIATAWAACVVVLVAGMRLHWRDDDRTRAELAECRADLDDARADARIEHAVADVCVDVLSRCREALDDRGFCSLWVAP